jgi:hypothetical protein
MVLRLRRPICSLRIRPPIGLVPDVQNPPKAVEQIQSPAMQEPRAGPGAYSVHRLRWHPSSIGVPGE